MPVQKKVYRGISKRARQLLDGDESINVDFKRSPSGLTSDDLVAFANAEYGGTLLLGVDEDTDAQGRQKGKVCGCTVSDEIKMNITNKAYQCIPPIDIEIYVENDATKPFYRVEILQGRFRPYCTSGGTYKIREDGRNKTLSPSELLALFMHEQSHQFSQRFEAASSKKLNNWEQRLIILEEKLDQILTHLHTHE